MHAKKYIRTRIHAELTKPGYQSSAHCYLRIIKKLGWFDTRYAGPLPAEFIYHYAGAGGSQE